MENKKSFLFIFPQTCFNILFKEFDILFYIKSPCFKYVFFIFNIFIMFIKTISKVMGYAIVFLSAVGKVPQILKIVIPKSVKGISLMSTYIEVNLIKSFYLYKNKKIFLKNIKFYKLLKKTIGFTFAMSYNVHYGYPFSTYGEFFFLAIQNSIIFLLFIYYNREYKMSTYLWLCILFYFLVILQMSGFIPEIVYKFQIFVNMLFCKNFKLK